MTSVAAAGLSAPPSTTVPKRKTISTSNIYADVPAEVTPVIGTHDGTFHCDEVLAISMLRLLPSYKDAAVVRTRDAAKLACCQIIVDVGAEYDPGRLRFDHHQRGFTDTMEGFSTKLSSAGLIYKHFGLQVIREIVGEDVPASVVSILFNKTYVDWLEHIDGIDNGVAVADGVLRYKVETHLSARVGRLNASWNEDASPPSQNARFSLALDLVSREFIDFVSSLAESWWPARQLVEAAFRQRLLSHSSGQVIVLNQYCPWVAHLFDIEEEKQKEGVPCPGETKYVLYDDGKGGWRIHAVPENVGSFTSRLALPEKWRGLRDAVLSQATGISGCTFVHANGFIGGANSLEACLKMADLAIEEAKGSATR